MKYITTTLSVCLALALFLALGIGGYYVLKTSLDAFVRLDFQSAAIIVAAIVTFLMAMLIARGLRGARRRKTAQLFHAEKAATYQLFTEVWPIRMQSTVRDQATASDELSMLDRLLSLYGSPNVVKAYAVFRKSEQAEGAQNPSTASLLAKVLIEMRRDLGLGVGGLTIEDVRQLALSDFSQPVVASATVERRDQQPRVSLTAHS